MRVETQSHILSAIRERQTQIAGLGVARVGLFGSFLRDEQRESSDIDLLVEFAPGRKTFDNFMQAAFLLEELLGRRVELVTPEALSPYLSPSIIGEAEYVTIGA